jgi:hypothetical protein
VGADRAVPIKLPLSVGIWSEEQDLAPCDIRKVDVKIVFNSNSAIVASYYS